MAPDPHLHEFGIDWLPHRSDLNLSLWARSRARRALEIIVIVGSAPVFLPLIGIIAMAVGITSGFPILFRQTRNGAFGSTFQILKFRTMRLTSNGCASAIAAESAHRITSLGAFLRRTRLDELPQVWNVLRGEMSLVGPRPKVPEQEPEPLPCRPGITGVAALAFAHEDTVLKGLAPDLMAHFFDQQILPAKLRLDVAYMSKASLTSDLRIVLDTVLGRWKPYAMDMELADRWNHPDEVSKERSMLF